jgi:multisubunit Na+/H+ antiporter MnhB subunit
MDTRQGVAILMDYRQSRPWMELILPLYTLALVILYYRPQALPLAIEETLLDGMFRWVIWGIVGALGGVLALSALFLTFYLLYSPFYLVENVKRILDPHVWVDQREVRFYLSCFVLLLALVALALMKPDAALVSFVLLAGSAQFLWRFLV